MDRRHEWMRTVLGEPAISATAERELARRTRQGDGCAREQLIRSGLRHVIQRAHLLGFRGEVLDDAIQAGCLGLITAVDRFDPEQGVRLRTYAWWWIGDAMKSAVPRREYPLPEELAVPDDEDSAASFLVPDDLPRVLRLRYRLGEEPGPVRSRREVAGLLGISEEQVRAREGRAMRQLRERLAKVVHRAPRVGADPP